MSNKQARIKEKKKKERQAICIFICKILISIIITAMLIGYICWERQPVMQTETTEIEGKVVSVELDSYYHRANIMLHNGQTYYYSSVIMLEHNVDIENLQETILNKTITLHIQYSANEIVSMEMDDQVLFDYALYNQIHRRDAIIYSITFSFWIIGGCLAFAIPKLIKELQK